jgi:hypothetical protein
MPGSPTLRRKTKLLPPVLRQAQPLHLVLVGLTCVLALVTILSTSGITSGPKTGRLRVIAPPNYFSQLHSPGKPKPPKIEHPIPAKIKAAEAKFSRMIAGQSRSLSKAVAEYKRRYGRPPPKGFDDWYAFATANGAVIIDEYDQLMTDLRPFWLLTGAEIRRRSLDVGLLPSVDLVRVQDGRTRTVDVRSGFDDAEVGARAVGFRDMLVKFQGASCTGRARPAADHGKAPAH